MNKLQTHVTDNIRNLLNDYDADNNTSVAPMFDALLESITGNPVGQVEYMAMGAKNTETHPTPVVGNKVLRDRVRGVLDYANQAGYRQFVGDLQAAYDRNDEAGMRRHGQEVVRRAQQGGVRSAALDQLAGQI